MYQSREHRIVRPQLVDAVSAVTTGLTRQIFRVRTQIAYLSFLYIALISRVTRTGHVGCFEPRLHSDSRAKGLSEFAIVFPHALKNAAVPIATVIGLGFASLIAGAVVIETVFAIPGLGSLTVSAILSRDYPAI